MNCIQKENQTKYEYIKAMNFVTVIFKKWLIDDDIKMYSTHNEGIYVAAEKPIRTLEKQDIKIHDFDNKKRVYW